MRGLNNDKFPLLSPEDMPEHAKELVKKLDHLKQAYLAGENFYIDKEKTMLLQDLCRRGYMGSFVHRIGGYQSGLLRTEIAHGTLNPIIAENTIENISNFSKYLSNKNISFIYMQIPCKLSPNGDNLPEGVSNETNVRADIILQGLNKNNVNTLDYRKIMVDNNINFNESFFKTDHHWKPLTVFDATNCLCHEIEKLIEMGMDKEKLNIKNYDVMKYKSIFLGNCGRESNVLYSGLDDLDLILPKYDTNYSWHCIENNLTKQGSAKEALIYPLQLDWKHYVTNPYASYSLTHDGYNVIQNHNSNNDKKILLLNDSFSNPLASFLAPQFSELHFLDLRGNKKDLFGIIEKVKPDIVVMLYSTFTIFHFKLHELMRDMNL